METTALSDAARTVISYIAPLIAGGALAKIGETAANASQHLLGQAWDALSRAVRGDRTPRPP
jgi:hypothetical protein